MLTWGAYDSEFKANQLDLGFKTWVTEEKQKSIQ